MDALGELNRRYPRLFHKEDDEDNGASAKGNILFRRYGWIVTIDALSEGRPERYPYFENLNVIPFLNLLQFHADKQQEIRDQQEIERAEREAEQRLRR